MKRSTLMLVLGLLAFVLAAGFSDSSVTKETSTYQVAQDDYSDCITSSMNVEAVEFNLNSPDLGTAEPVSIHLVAMPSKGYLAGTRAPPDATMSKIRSNYCVIG